MTVCGLPVIIYSIVLGLAFLNSLNILSLVLSTFLGLSVWGLAVPPKIIKCSMQGEL